MSDGEERGVDGCASVCLLDLVLSSSGLDQSGESTAERREVTSLGCEGQGWAGHRTYRATPWGCADARLGGPSELLPLTTVNLGILPSSGVLLLCNRITPPKKLQHLLLLSMNPIKHTHTFTFTLLFFYSSLLPVYFSGSKTPEDDSDMV